MSTFRDGFGRVKRTEPNRDYRRAHLQGAHNMILKGLKKPDDFKGRVRELLKRVFR